MNKDFPRSNLSSSPEPRASSPQPAMTVIINGRPVIAESDDTIYMARGRPGFRPQPLPFSHQLAPFGSCDSVSAKSMGSLGLPPPAQLQFRPDIGRRTESDRLRRHRHNIVELYVSEQPEGSVTSGPFGETWRSRAA